MTTAYDQASDQRAGADLGVAVPSRSGRHSSREKRRTLSSLRTVGLPALAAALVVVVWWLVTVLFNVKPFFLPPPSAVVQAFLDLPDHLLEQTWVTLSETLIGFAIAVVGGFLLAVALTASRTVQQATLPLLVALNSVPKVALAPLLLLWLGLGQLPRVVMVVLISFFPVVVAAMAGLASTPAELSELARSLTASRWQAFMKVRLPWAIPQVFIGLKVAISLAVVGAVVAEFTGSGEGLGYVILASGVSANTALAFAAIALLGVVSVALFYIVVGLERLLVPWARETTG